MKKSPPLPVGPRRGNNYYLFVAAFAFACYMVFTIFHDRTRNHSNSLSQKEIAESDAILASAFSNHIGGFKVSGQGEVVKVLPDDNSGTRHQRFIVKLASGQTILIAHNIDIASRINALPTRDTVRFSGQYEWNDQGGVVHNTHRDPKGRHPGGWIEHAGKRFE
jgi:Protein of unknown function (DUF3465)